MSTRRMGRPRIPLAEGARNVAWHDAVAAVTKLSDRALDETYANYLSDGGQRADGGRHSVFGRISREAFDPAYVRDDRAISVFEAVGRDSDPLISAINRDIYDSLFWRLLTPPPLSESELLSLIDELLAQNDLYRVSGKDPIVDIKAGNTFLKDSVPFHYESEIGFDRTVAVIASWETFDGLALLAALTREQLMWGEFANLRMLRQGFNDCLRNTVERYGIRKDIGLLIHWLAYYRVFANRWKDVPTRETRSIALNRMNYSRLEENKKPIKEITFWVEALALRYHNSERSYRYPIVPKTPPIFWLEANRATLSRQMDEEDSGKEVDGMYYCPIFDLECPSTADAGRESESGAD